MSQVFIVGGAGKIARRLSKQLCVRGYLVRALHRNPDQAEELEALGVTPVLGNLLELDADGLATLMAGSDVVVFSAGAGGKGGQEKTNAIDGRGLAMAVAAAQTAGAKRFLLVSAFPESFRGRQVSETFENYMSVKKLADVRLAESDLDWVILRPGTLVDTPGNGKVRAGLAIPYAEVSRDDVARTLFELIEQPKIRRVIIELTQGDVPVDIAVRRFTLN